MTRWVIDNFRERLRQCEDNNGSHLTDLIFKTKWNRMALYVLFENKNTFLFLYFICLLLNLQMCQIILPDPILSLIWTHALKEKNIPTPLSEFLFFFSVSVCFFILIFFKSFFLDVYRLWQSIDRSKQYFFQGYHPNPSGGLS